MLSVALQSANALCKVLLIWIEFTLDYMCAQVQSGQKSQTF